VQRNNFLLFTSFVTVLLLSVACVKKKDPIRTNTKPVAKSNTFVTNTAEQKKTNNQKQYSIHKNTNNFAIIISGPSGVGKDTLAKELMFLNKDLKKSISSTTRQPRYNEVNGVDYHFISKESFQQYLQTGYFLETTSYSGNLYGTGVEEYNNAVKDGNNIIFVTDFSGMKNIRAKEYINTITVFIAPPSLKVLEARLKNRGTETVEQFNNRLRIAKQELNYAKEYDYVIYNCDINSATKILDALYLSEKFKRGL